MKTNLLVLLLGFGLLFTIGCATPYSKGGVDVTAMSSLEDIHTRVLAADKKWVEESNIKRLKDWNINMVAIERRMYEKIRNRDVAPWRIRRAGLNYIVAVNEALIPDVPKPPGRYTSQNHPFM